MVLGLLLVGADQSHIDRRGGWIFGRDTLVQGNSHGGWPPGPALASAQNDTEPRGRTILDIE
jgi:hypothetical protein